LIPDDEEALAEAGDGGLYILNAVYDQRTCGTAEKIALGQAVNVGVIPVKTRGLVQRKGEAILKRSIRIDQGPSNIITTALWSYIGSVIMKIHGRTR
jgi:hypothetical protein